MPFKDSYYLQLWQLACFAEQIRLDNLVEGIIRNISVKLFSL